MAASILRTQDLSGVWTRGHNFPRLLALVAASMLSITHADEAKVDFRRDVLPILSEHCFACHGFDENARQADLRLDTFEGASGADGSVAAVVPGQPDQSELISRINSDDEDLRMQPAATAHPFTDDQRQVLQDWIAQGETYRKHWSF